MQGIEPFGLLYLLLLHLDLSTLVVGREAEHQLRRERPALAAEITDVTDAEMRLFVDLTSHRLLGRLACLHEAGNAGEDVLIALGMSSQEDAVTPAHQDDDAGFDARENQLPALRTAHGRELMVWLHLMATMAAKMSILQPADQSLGSRRMAYLQGIAHMEMLANGQETIIGRQQLLVGDAQGTDIRRLLLDELHGSAHFGDTLQVGEAEHRTIGMHRHLSIGKGIALAQASGGVDNH